METQSRRGTHTHICGVPRRDASSIALLFILYTLQGVPMGLSGSIPFILNERDDVTMSQIAMFSLVSWPFSLKILWAPLVDSIFIARIGRRKTWVVPTQLAIGLILYLLAGAIAARVSGTTEDDSPTEIYWLTVVFFGLYFLCATQDIAVDGWALTMLTKENVGWAATCNSAGQAFGAALSYTGLLVLLKYEVMSLQSFVQTCGLIFIVVTTIVAIFKSERGTSSSLSAGGTSASAPHEVQPLLGNATKQTDGAASIAQPSGAKLSALTPTPTPTQKQKQKQKQKAAPVAATKVEAATKSSEKPPSVLSTQPARAAAVAVAAAADEYEDEEESLSMRETFSQISGVVMLPSVRQLLLVLFTCKVPFVVIDQVAPLRLQKAGFTKETLAIFSMLISPCAIALPPLIAKFTSGTRPFNVFMRVYATRLALGFAVTAVVAYCTVAGYGAEADIGSTETAANAGAPPMAVLIVAFLINIAYALIGTSMFVSQMSFFNRISDPRIGGSYMTLVNTMANLGYNLPSYVVMRLVDPLTAVGKAIHPRLDGFFLLALLSTLYGILWRLGMDAGIERMQSRPPADWLSADAEGGGKPGAGGAAVKGAAARAVAAAGARSGAATFSADAKVNKGD